MPRKSRKNIGGRGQREQTKARVTKVRDRDSNPNDQQSVSSGTKRKTDCMKRQECLQRMKKLRSDPDYRQLEQERDTRAHQASREDPGYRNTEQEINSACHKTKRNVNTNSYDYLVGIFNAEVREGPTHVCSCCGGLWYRRSVKEVTRQGLVENSVPDLMINDVLQIQREGKFFLCGTCYNSVNQKQPKTPKLCLTNGFAFPNLPNCLKTLTLLEERLVSPRIPFMQIRSLGFCGQSGLRGNVVNVVNDLDICAKVLPRIFSDTQTIQVMLMRRMVYKSPYMYETIRPAAVYEAAKYLSSTDLYKKEGIVLSHDWNAHLDKTQDFVVNPEDKLTITELNKDSETCLRDSDSDSDEESNEVNCSCDETLMLGEDNTLTNKIIRIAPGEGKIPLSLLRDLEAQVLSFPKIYGGVCRKFKEGLKVTFTDIAKSEFRRYDRRACTTANLLYSCKLLQTHRVASAITLCLRKKKGGQNIKAGDVKTTEGIEGLISHDDGFRCLRGVRQSPAYMEVMQKKIMAMLRQLGLPTFFITLSAAETKWPELLVNLEKILHGNSIDEETAMALPMAKKADLIRSDPITCARNFDHRYRSLLNNLLTKSGGIFSPHKVIDYFQRVENQIRGSPHSHGLYWLPNAPLFDHKDPSSYEACIQYIDQYITCKRHGDDDLASVIGYQIHRHSHTCKRFRRGKKICRFGLPKPPMPSTRILLPLPEDCDSATTRRAEEDFQVIHAKLNEFGRTFDEVVPFNQFLTSLKLTEERYILAVRSSLKRPSVILKRETCEVFVNPYNEKLLKAWRANIDIQFILDPFACGKYCVSYIGKSAGGISKLLRQITEELRRGNFTLQDRLRKVSNCFLNCTEISAQEAAYWVLGMPFTSSSRQCVYVNTGLPAERTFLIKSSKDLKELEDSSEDIGEDSLLDHYEKRSESLEEVCLAEFSAYYDYKKNTGGSEAKEYGHIPEPIVERVLESRGFKQKIGVGKVVKRFKAKVIRYRRYGKAEDPPNYFREQCMLYIPWRNEQTDILNHDPSELYLRNVEQILMQRAKYDPSHNPDEPDIIDMVQQNEEEVETRGVLDEDYSVDISDSMKAKTKSDRIDFISSPKILEDQEYSKVIRSLNNNQRKFFVHMINSLLEGKTDELYNFVMGGAGVGKSHLITAIVQTLIRAQLQKPGQNPNSVYVLVCAATGKAAHNVRGITLHCAFKLPPNQYGGNLTRLSDDICNSLRAKLRDLKLIVIDEISMLSSRQLHQINDRLKQLFESSKEFGGIPILAVGDLRQIRPFGGRFVFESLSNSLADLIAGNVLWQKFRMFELTEIMRQKDDLRFAQALNNMADGNMTEEDMQLIRSRMITAELQPPEDAIRLYGSNKNCDEYNASVHKTLQTEEALSVAFDRIQGNCTENQRLGLLEYAKTLPTKDTDGLPNEVLLKVGAIYMVSLNVDVGDGLFNGSTGVLRGILYGTRSGARIPVRVLMEFNDPLVGASARATFHQFQLNDENRWTPVGIFHKALTKSGHKESAQIVREQIPLIPANGITFEKSQGSTYKSVVVCTRGRTRRDLIYVGCSRATSLNGLFIDGDFSSPKPLEPLVANEITRLRSIPLSLNVRFLQDVPNTHYKMIFHNVQSLHKHFVDIKADHCYIAADLMTFVEPWTLPHDSYAFPGFSTIHRQDSYPVRNSTGSIVFGKNVLGVSSMFYDKVSGQNGHFNITRITLDSTTILIVYKSPTASVKDFCAMLTVILEELARSLLIVVGDFNIELGTTNPVRSLLESYGLQSKLDDSPSTYGGSIIDWCFSNVALNAWYYESTFSYHKPICITWPNTEMNQSQPQPSSPSSSSPLEFDFGCLNLN